MSVSRAGREARMTRTVSGLAETTKQHRRTAKNELKKTQEQPTRERALMCEQSSTWFRMTRKVSLLAEKTNKKPIDGQARTTKNHPRATNKGACLNEREQSSARGPHDAHSLLAATPHRSFNARNAQSVHQVARQPKGNQFGRGRVAASLKRNAQVNVHELGSCRVDENVVAVAVTEADDKADHGVDGQAVRVRDALLVPAHIGQTDGNIN